MEFVGVGVWPFTKIKELERLNQVHRAEIDSLALQLEGLRETNSTLERWLSEVKREKEELKENLYRVTGIVRNNIQQAHVNLERLPVGPVRVGSVLKKLEHNARERVKPITKESIEEAEKEVGLNASS